MAMDMSGLSAPIPGENFTSDTKNYPWHRPPQFTDLDPAIEYIGKKLLEEDAAVAALTMIEAGVTIVSVTQMYMMHGMMEGRWTFDYAILLAGPTAHILYIMAKSYGIECDLGIDSKEKPITVAMLKEMADLKETIDPGNARRAAEDATMQVVGEEGAGPEEETTEAPAPMGGFMGAQPPQPPQGVPGGATPGQGMI
jgi:hypothetical protein